MTETQKQRRMLTTTRWNIEPDFRDTNIAQAFRSLETVFAIEPTGALAAADSESMVFRHDINGTPFYVKRYHSTKGLRSWLGWSRIRIEWKNLLLFRRLGVPAAPVVAYGQERCLTKTIRGALITVGLENTRDLATMAQENSPLLRDRAWVQNVSRQVAEAARKLHDYGFAHNDFKWRNILVTQDRATPQIYLIDCPTGQRWFGYSLRYRVLKDVACLDKVAKQQLSRTQRLRFFLDYRGQSKLRNRDKKDIRKILSFFEGRE
ncbi:lipopolysaccharide kinase InaA family protein [Kistimonas asteriae]|uniref:lipopolysaccharide kinase InaA family protein n=1 Tax=Kistimonas asteriae TaxID=517724 RepID=UPI001BAE2CD1